MTANQSSAWLFSELCKISEFSNRVFPDIASEGTKNPCAIFQEIDSERDERLDSGARGEAMIAYQIRIYAGSRRKANELRDKARELLENRERAELSGWELQGTAWGDGPATYDVENREYGATAVLEICGS